MSVNVVSIFATGDYEGVILRAQNILRSGGVVVMPTETIYGAAGMLTHPEARRRLGELRGSSGTQPFTIHLPSPDAAGRYIGEVTEFGRRMMKKLWPGPVGLNFEVSSERQREVARALNLSERDLFDDSGITLRCPDHIVAADVLGGLDGPIVLTSANGGANESGAQMAERLGDKADLILDAGPTRYSKPSTLLKVNAEGYEIVRQGVYDERIIERLLRTTILFVCSGNTCRSPMAEGIARQVLARKLEVPETELERKGIIVLSAGTFALPGARATAQGVEAVRGMGIDLSHHRSRPLTVELIHQADVIFTMSRNHAQQVMALVPSAADKVSTLDPMGDIEDPIGGDIALYQELAGQLRVLIERRLEETVLPEHAPAAGS